MNKVIQKTVFGLMLAAAALLTPAMADSCKSNNLFSGKIMTDICWGCLFPIRFASASLGESDGVPSGATDKVVCKCGKGLNSKFGFTLGYWEPARIYEFTREPGCMMSLGGVRIPAVNRQRQGMTSDPDKPNELSYMHFHMYTFPIMQMLELYVSSGCVSDGVLDFDLGYFSEIDPTWNDDELAFFTAPESALAATLPAQAACPIDAAIAATGKVSDKLWWCAGSWGSLYPLSGFSAAGGFVNDTSLRTARAVTAMHRRGFEAITMGDDALCKASYSARMPKSQYKISMFYPKPEAKSTHVIGESELRWGMGRTVPGREDAAYILYRWNDCCEIAAEL